MTDKKLDEKDIKMIFETYKIPLLNYIHFKTRHEEESKDLLSKTFVKFIYYSQKQLIRMDEVKSLLYKIASTTVIDHFRRKKIISFISLNSKTDEHSDELFNLIIDPKSLKPYENIDHKNTLKEVSEIIKSLPADQKEAFRLRFYDHLSFKDIASIQKTSLGTALSRVRYAVLKIKDSLNQIFEGELKS